MEYSWRFHFLVYFCILFGLWNILIAPLDTKNINSWRRFFFFFLAIYPLQLNGSRSLDPVSRCGLVINILWNKVIFKLICYDYNISTECDVSLSDLCSAAYSYTIMNACAKQMFPNHAGHSVELSAHMPWKCISLFDSLWADMPRPELKIKYSAFSILGIVVFFSTSLIWVLFIYFFSVLNFGIYGIPL